MLSTETNLILVVRQYDKMLFVSSFCFAHKDKNSQQPTTSGVHHQQHTRIAGLLEELSDTCMHLHLKDAAECKRSVADFDLNFKNNSLVMQFRLGTEQPPNACA